MAQTIFVQNYNEGKELELIRQHHFPLLIQNAAAKYVNEYQENKWLIYKDKTSEYTPEEMFIIELDCIRGNLVENCKIRKYISYKMQTSLENERVTILALKHEYRSYVTECVTFYERLASLLAYLSKCYKSDGLSFEDDIIKLHEFFNPEIIELRNTNTHQHYISKQQFQKIEQVEGQLQDLQFQGIYLNELTENFLGDLNLVITDEVKWFDYTENEFTKFLEKFFDRLSNKITINDELIIPNTFPKNLSFSPKIHKDFRRRLKHNDIFNPQDD